MEVELSLGQAISELGSETQWGGQLSLPRPAGKCPSDAMTHTAGSCSVLWTLRGLATPRGLDGLGAVLEEGGVMESCLGLSLDPVCRLHTWGLCSSFLAIPHPL